MEKVQKVLLQTKTALGKAAAFIWLGIVAAGRGIWVALKWLGSVLWLATRATDKFLAKTIQGFFRLLGKIIDDLLATAGAGFISYGVYIIYRPAGFITLGVLLIAGACVVARFKGRR